VKGQFAMEKSSPAITPTAYAKPAVRRRGAYSRIKQAILSGDFQPGEPLIETVLAEWCEVSRTPIREALNRLEQDGMVVRTDRGLVVREDSPDDVLDLYETRITLEAAAARVAAERRTFHDLLQMKELANSMTTMKSRDPQAMAEANERFHRSVWRASHNRSLVDLLDRLNMHLGRYPATTLSFPGRWERGNEQHLRIVEAIEAHEGDLSAQLATEHFTESRDIRLKLWTSQGPT
jgi:DNA-binding GntR family transcriptional regulator